MAINDNSVVQYESAVNPAAFEAMTDSGDQKTFTSSFSPWSRLDAAGLAVRPYGIATGGVIIPAVSGTNDLVDISALTAYMANASGADAEGLITITATTDHSVARPTLDYIITSITINSSGALANVAGTEHASAWSTTRGAAGGPPLIPDGSVELGQVWYSSSSSAAVTASEIYQVTGSSIERSNFPVFSINYATGEITFASALPTIHTGTIPKQVWVKGGTPIFANVARAFDWVPAETTYTVASTPTYDGPVGSRTTAIGAATFSALMEDGITDPILDQLGEIIWIKFFQDEDKAPFQLTQGTLGVARTFVVDDNVTGNFTLAPDSESTNNAS